MREVQVKIFGSKKELMKAIQHSCEQGNCEQREQEQQSTERARTRCRKARDNFDACSLEPCMDSPQQNYQVIKVCVCVSYPACILMGACHTCNAQSRE